MIGSMSDRVYDKVPRQVGPPGLGMRQRRIGDGQGVPRTPEKRPLEGMGNLAPAGPISLRA
jgi:hypothetical protein